MSKHRAKWLIPVAAMLLFAAACSDDSDDSDSTTTTEATTDDRTDTGMSDTSGERAAGEFGCTDSIPDCDGTIEPAEGLTDGAMVSIEASGFSPDIALGITQCTDTNDPDNNLEETDSGDCNLRGIGNTMSDSEGNVSAEFSVVAGQTMVDNTANGRTCDAEHDCVVSVGQLTPDPDAERITFTVKFA